MDTTVTERCFVRTYDAIAWDRPPRLGPCHPTEDGFGAVVQLRSPDATSAQAPASGDLVLMVMRATRHAYEAGSVGPFPVAGALARGRVVLIPPGVSSRFVSTGHPELLHLHLGLERLEQLTQAGPSSLMFRAQVGIHDPVVERLAQQLVAELRTPAALARLAIDSIVLALAVHLVRQHGEGARAEQCTESLAPWRLRRVLDLIEARLDADLRLEDLAAEAGLSSSHFARCFKHVTGVSPYRFVLQRRVERAKALLEGTEAPLSDIALQCGFASQSHMTDTFRSMTGMAPGRWRRSVSVQPLRTGALTAS